VGVDFGFGEVCCIIMCSFCVLVLVVLKLCYMGLLKIKNTFLGGGVVWVLMLGLFISL